MSLIDRRDEALPVAFPYFGGTLREHFPENDQGADVLLRKVPARRVATAEGDVYVATVFDLMCANYGVDRGLGDGCARRTTTMSPTRRNGRKRSPVSTPPS